MIKKIQAIIISSIFLLAGCSSTKIQQDDSVSISQIQTLKNKKAITQATTKDVIHLKAKTRNIPNKTAVEISIYEKTKSNEFVKVGTIQTCVKNNVLDAEWTVKYVIGEHNSGDDNFGADYKCPEYYFIAEYEDCKSVISEPLKLYTNFYCTLKFQDRVLKGYPYVLKLPDGTSRSGETDENGMIIEKNIPIGNVYIL